MSPTGSPRGGKKPPQDIMFAEFTLSGQLHGSDPAQSTFGGALATRASGVPLLSNGAYSHTRAAVISTSATPATAQAMRDTYGSSGTAALKVTALDVGGQGFLTTAATTVEAIPYAEGVAPARPHILHVDLQHEPVTQSGESHSASRTPATSQMHAAHCVHSSSCPQHAAVPRRHAGATCMP